jgi:hypothetical protein
MTKLYNMIVLEKLLYDGNLIEGILYEGIH